MNRQEAVQEVVDAVQALTDHGNDADKVAAVSDLLAGIESYFAQRKTDAWEATHQAPTDLTVARSEGKALGYSAVVHFVEDVFSELGMLEQEQEVGGNG